jgi:hypothetical protein
VPSGTLTPPVAVRTPSEGAIAETVVDGGRVETLVWRTGRAGEFPLEPGAEEDADPPEEEEVAAGPSAVPALGASGGRAVLRVGEEGTLLAPVPLPLALTELVEEAEECLRKLEGKGKAPSSWPEAASTKPWKGGLGLCGWLWNSGWYCAAKKKGWTSRSNSTISMRTWRSSVPTKKRPALCSCDT